MPLHRAPSAKGILYLAFNQDNTCISIADYKGIKIYSLDTHKVLYQSDLGAVRYARVSAKLVQLLTSPWLMVGPGLILCNFCSIAEMLFCTSLMAYVGAGEQPTLTPRKLFLINTATGCVSTGSGMHLHSSCSSCFASCVASTRHRIQSIVLHVCVHVDKATTVL